MKLWCFHVEHFGYAAEPAGLLSGVLFDMKENGERVHAGLLEGEALCAALSR